MAHSRGLGGLNGNITRAIGAGYSGDLHTEGGIAVARGNREGNLAALGEVNGTVTALHVGATPRRTQRDGLVATSILATIDGAQQSGRRGRGGTTALAVHLQGVAGHIGTCGLVGPVGTEARAGDIVAVGGAHHGSVGRDGCVGSSTRQGYGLALSTRAGNGDGGIKNNIDYFASTYSFNVFSNIKYSFKEFFFSIKINL